MSAPNSDSDSPDDSSSDLSPETLDHLRLALVPGLGPKLTRAVLDHFGSAAAVLRATAPQLQAVPLIGPTLADRFAAGFRAVDATLARELALLRANGVRVTLWGSPDYPSRLTTIDDAPTLLYYRGTWDAADANAVGIVGSRSCTAYGKRVAAQIATGLTRAGYTVVSGLALGIDGAAHQAALDAGGRTVAVLGGGLAKIYPPQHVALADAVAKAGLLLTETPMVVPTTAAMFPARNRVISALSRAVVVIEANDQSGALITARHAAEQGREVFVVPGDSDSPARPARPGRRNHYDFKHFRRISRRPLAASQRRINLSAASLSPGGRRWAARRSNSTS